MAASAPTRPTSSLGRSPLKTYITIAAVAVIPLAAFLFLAHNLLKRDSVARVTAQSSQAAKVYGTLVDQHFTETSVFLQSFAVRREVLRDWQAKRFDAISADLKQLHALRPDFQGFGMFDVDGAFRAGDPAPQSSSQNFASRDWYQGVRREWKPYVSSVFPAANDGALVVAVAVPVFDQDHRPVGILVGGQSLAMVTKQLYGVLNAQNASLILVVDQKGQVFGKPTADAAVALLPANPALAEALADRSKPSAGRITTVAGRSVITSFAPLPSSGWGILVNVPVEFLQRAIWDYERNLALLAAIVIVVAIVAGVSVARLYRRFQRAEQQYLRDLEETNEALKAFNYSVSHDLQAPLRAMAGYATILNDDYSARLDTTARSYLQHISESAARMSSLIHNLLEYSRLSRAQFRSEAVSLQLAIDEARKQLQGDLQRTGAEVQESGAFPRVLGNQALLNQAITNLISNAVKFVPQGCQPKIAISTQQHHDRVRLSIRDNGIGIPMKYRETIFKPFERLHAEERFPGSGIGLAIVSKAVERMSGRLGFESEAGVGTEFWIELPIANN